MKTIYKLKGAAKGTFNIVVYDDVTKSFVLKVGASIENGSEFFNSSPRFKSVVALRESTSTLHQSGKFRVTSYDVEFKSSSGLATYSMGTSKNGSDYLKSHTISTENSGTDEPKTAEKNTEKDKTTIIDSVKQKDLLAKTILTFCKDFAFKPDPRLLNSLYYEENPNQYIVNTMKVTGYDDALLQKAKEKFKSPEWQQIIETLKSVKPSHGKFNQRLEIKFGSAGTGKTTAAIAENPKAHKIVASASADPDDLFTMFDPSTKNYELTDIAKAMISGEAIIIDEANLYNPVVLTRLQGITDTIYDRGREIKIADGFKIVMTLNLETNYGKTPLPNPLVSRASKIENYDDMLQLGWVW